MGFEHEAFDHESLNGSGRKCVNLWISINPLT